MAKISLIFLMVLTGPLALAGPSCEKMVGQMIITNPPPEPHKDIGGVILFGTNFAGAHNIEDVQVIVNKYAHPAGGIPRFVSTDNEGGGPPASKAERDLFNRSHGAEGRPASVQRLNSLQGYHDMPYDFDMRPDQTLDNT
jgi:hypothetical protein